jgi:hypothetical protein
MFGVEWLSGQNGQPPPNWNYPRWALFFLLVLAGNVVVAALAWFIVGLVMR